jgi:RNA polymerase sigma factor (sigma-70 family)
LEKLLLQRPKLTALLSFWRTTNFFFSKKNQKFTVPLRRKMALTPPRHPARSDAELLDAIRRSPEERDRAIDSLWNDTALRKMTLAALPKMLRDDEKAKEILGEALVRFTRAAEQGKFRGDSSIRTYIVGICINLGKKAVSRPPKHSKWEQSLPPEDLEQIGPETSDSPENIFLEQESEDILVRLFRKLYRLLPAHCEKSLRWFYSDDQSVRAIAEAAQIKEQSVKTRLLECRKKLRERIEQDPEAMKIIQERRWNNWKK